MGFPVELKIEGKRVLIVGGGDVATRKFSKIIDFNPSFLKVIAQEISQAIKQKAKGLDNVKLAEEKFKDRDIEEFDLVFLATDDSEFNRRIVKRARKQGILVNVADDPELCDFYMPATIKRGRLLISVSTEGAAPSFSAALKRLIQQKLPIDELSQTLELVSDLRSDFIEKRFQGRRDIISALSSDYVSRISYKNKRGIYLLGFNHKTSPIHIRERALKVLERLKDELDEAVLLSTCNRVELYFSSEQFEELLGRLPDEFKKYLYFRTEEKAFKHLTLVASGCDSLALGETQIAGQVKRAYDEARNKGKTGKLLNRLFEGALKAAKEIRSRTGIQESSTSVPSLAIKLANKKLLGLSGKKVGILGTGEVARILLRNLKLGGVYLIGRNREKLDLLSKEHSARPVHLDELENVLKELDLLFVATSSPVPFLRKDRVKSAVEGKRILIVDLSVPRNVAEDVEELEGVECVFLDELKETAAENLKRKEGRLREAEGIAQIEAERFKKWYENLEAEEIILSLFKKLEKVPAERLFRKAIKRIKGNKELALAFKEIFEL